MTNFPEFEQQSEIKEIERLDCSPNNQNRAIAETEDSLYGSLEFSSEFSSPFLPPHLLKAYEDICPGAAERTMAMAEKEQNHQHYIQASLVKAQIDDLQRSRIERRVGQFCGLIIGLTTVCAGSYVAVQGKQVAGGLIGTAGVAGLVSVFVVGRKAQQEEAESFDDE
jgi:uncharacterized membrane protein